MLKNGIRAKELYKELFPLVQSLGYTIVDVDDSVIRKERHVHLVVRNPRGNTSLDDCSAVSRLVYPRLLVLYECQDLHLEVSSPGIHRNLKDIHEFEIFMGERMKILVGENWIEGTLEACSESSIELLTEKGRETYLLETIKKAKLVSRLKEK